MTKKYIPRLDEIPSGLCECGCGKSTSISKTTLVSKRYFRGYPLPALKGHPIHRKPPPRNTRATLPGKQSPFWRGGKFTDPFGYVWIHCPEHPNAHKHYMLEHRLIMEKLLGRLLERSEKIHHINGNRADNREDNLQLMTQKYHAQIHLKQKRRPQPPGTRKATSERMKRIWQERWEGLRPMPHYPALP